MNESQRRAWAALDIGPAWVLRAPPSEAAAHGAALVSEPQPQSRPTQAPTPEGPPAPLPPALSEPPMSAAPGRDDLAGLDLDGLRERVATCRDCGLCESRNRTVFGVGDRRPHWMVIGEAPGAEEDRRGEPFVGQAGRLLDAMLAAVGLGREQGVFIANVLKCRPPGNRNPRPEEVARCAPFLRRQVELLRPRLILVVGRFAAQTLLGTDASIASLRGRVHRYRAGELDVPVVVSYHPAYLLRDRHEDKARCWQDLCLARATAGPREQDAGPDGPSGSSPSQ
ncbi:MAG: uracil-DNA glycosylase [Burkholderiaceae bacterium]|jgi:DNA polymerase|nr:uracil-DNA glycosylase [Burkholderiaceae bacterium]MEB2319810.1 uracil-DNA glycosylase [Pseudomonadota bacterium]